MILFTQRLSSREGFNSCQTQGQGTRISKRWITSPISSLTKIYLDLKVEIKSVLLRMTEITESENSM
eukprot:6194178-Pleurochrysis_carterae.AAC.2